MNALCKWVGVTIGIVLAGAIHAGSAFADSLTLEGAVPLLAAPRLIAVNSVTHRAYMAVGNSWSPSSYSVSVISGTAHITDIPVGSGDWSTGPIFVAVNETTNRVYVNHTGANFANAIDGGTNTVIASFATGAYPEGMVTDPLTNRLYIANTNSGSVSVFDTSGDANTPVATISIPGTGAGITNLYLAIVPSTSRLYVTAPHLHKIFVVDTASNSIFNSFSVGGSPRYVVVNPVTNKLYLTLDGDPNVLVVNASTGEPVGYVFVSGPAWGLAVNPTLNHVYVTTTGSGANRLMVIDGVIDGVVATSEDLGSALAWVGVDTSNGRIYAATPWSSPPAVVLLQVTPNPSITTGTLTVTTTPVSGPIVVDGTLKGNGSISIQLPAGVHTVSFGDVSGFTTPSPQSVTITAGQTTSVTGTYAPLLPQLTLTVLTIGTGSGTVTSSPAGIACGADCAESYPAGTVVTLTATANPGATFVRWRGHADCADGQVTMSVAKTCAAVFTMVSLP